jgi:hypothetical protein
MNHIIAKPCTGSAGVGHSALDHHLSNPILRRALLSRTVSTIFRTHGHTTSENEQAALYPGYYMRCPDDQNYWIGRDKDSAYRNLNEAGKLFLKASFGYEYDIEYSFGQIVGGGSAWSNLSAAELMV